MNKHTLDEQETTFTQTAEERRYGMWSVFSNDPYWQRRLDERGECYREDGYGKWYRIEHRQLTLRKPGKKAIADDHPFLQEARE